MVVLNSIETTMVTWWGSPHDFGNQSHRDQVMPGWCPPRRFSRWLLVGDYMLITYDWWKLLLFIGKKWCWLVLFGFALRKMGADWWTNMCWLVLIDEEWVLIGVHWCWWVLLGWCWLLNTLRTNVLINWVRKSGPVTPLHGKSYWENLVAIFETHPSCLAGNPAICRFKLAGDTGDLWRFLSTQELASKYWCLTFVFASYSSMFLHCCYYSCFFPIWQDTICSVSYIRFSWYQEK